MTAARLSAASTPATRTRKSGRMPVARPPVIGARVVGTRPTRLRYWAAPLAAALLCCSLPVRAGLFDDDEARAKIEQLRSQVDVIQKSAVARLGALETAVQDKRALIDLATSIDSLRDELAQIRGQIEVLSNQVAQGERRQKDLYADLDARLRRIEKAREDEAKAAEAAKAQDKAQQDSGALEGKAYEAALGAYKAARYQEAIEQFQALVQANPLSELAPSAQYWTGNALFALKDYKRAVTELRKLVLGWPENPRASDSLLTIASAQAELGDAKAEHATLTELVAHYPKTPAADQAKQRLARKPASTR